MNSRLSIHTNFAMTTATGGPEKLVENEMTIRVRNVKKSCESSHEEFKLGNDFYAQQDKQCGKKEENVSDSYGDDCGYSYDDADMCYHDNEGSGDVEWDKIINDVKSDRTWCVDCKRAWPQRDHHCHFLGVCIHKHNRYSNNK